MHNLTRDEIEGTRALARIWANNRRKGKEATVKAMAEHIRKKLAARGRRRTEM